MIWDGCERGVTKGCSTLTTASLCRFLVAWAEIYSPSPVMNRVRFGSAVVADGLGGGRVSDLQLGSDGAVWAATDGGLSRVKDGHVTTLTTRNGLPCGVVHWVIEDNDHSTWLNQPCGLVRIARSELDAWASDPTRSIHATVFDSSDGVRARATAGRFGPKVTKSIDGKIWFSPLDGVSIIDPRHLPFNEFPPPVYVQQITAAKHSEAKKVEVRLTRSNGQVSLFVSDDGVGCAPDQIRKSGGLGLINMRERVLQLDGTFEFDSEPGRGTTVRVALPFRAAS